MTDTLPESLEVGRTLEPLILEPISRLTLALYAGGSGDHNPIHVDIDAAHEAGLDDVIAHGMLPMAYLGRLVTRVVPHTEVRSMSVRFAAMTHVGDRLVCRAEVAEITSSDEELRALLKLVVSDDTDEVKLSGEAIVALKAPTGTARAPISGDSSVST